MSDMTTVKAAALRKPFPASAIGKLPKAGITLDYVGHAATTDRLLSVDPNWTWEPMAVDERGLPVLDSKGNLWIRLTVCGVTRLGVGDGKGAKEVIGDAIRNAAMRFGVALDLWSKEELEQFHGPAKADEPEVEVEAPAARTMQRKKKDAPTPDGAHDTDQHTDSMNDGQRAKMFAQFKELDITDRDTGLAYMTVTLGRDVESSKTLTKAEASRVIESQIADLEKRGASE